MSDDEQHPTSSRSRAISNKRDVHNFLERNRRSNIKNSFDELRDSLPCFQRSIRGRRRRPSRMQILRQASNFFKDSKKANNPTEIDRMRAQLSEVQRMIAIISAATASGNFEAAAPYVDRCLTAKREEEMPPPPEVKEDDDEDVEDEEDETTDSDDSQEIRMPQADFR